MAKKQKGSSALDGWHPIVGLMFYKTKKGVRMNVGLSRDTDGKWLAVAVESAADTAQGILDNHAHKFLGKFTLSKGIAAAEKYAREWVPGKGAPCACDDIAPAPKRSRSGDA